MVAGRLRSIVRTGGEDGELVYSGGLPDGRVGVAAG